MEATDPRAALDDLVTASGESYAALSRMLQRNEAYLQQYVKRGTPRLLAERDRKLLASYFRVDEAMFGGPTPGPVAPLTAQVRRLDVVASAGPGGLVEHDRPLGSELFDPRLLASLGVRENQCAVLRAQGDSMSPTIEDGDQMLVDESDRRATKRPGIFVIRLDGVLLVKRVARSGDLLHITSDNWAFPAMPPVAQGEVAIIGRVVWLSRTLRG
jgi:phage repressor protein C with HTH and peptisase S24 domain